MPRALAAAPYVLNSSAAALPAVDGGAVAPGSGCGADVLEAEGLGVVEDLVEVLGEGVRVRVTVVVVADVAADGAQAVVAGQPRSWARVMAPAEPWV